MPLLSRKVSVRAVATRLSLAASLALVLSAGVPACGHGCTMIGCSQDGYDLFFAEESTWGAGIHRISISYSPEHSDSITEWIDCQIYPYFEGRNIECESSDRIIATVRGIKIYDRPDYVNARVHDAEGWQFQEDFHPTYKETEPNGKGCGSCRYASNIIILDGPGELAGYVQDLYDGPEPDEGMGGAGASPTGEIGSECDDNADCAIPQFCSHDFLGDSSVCTASCHSDSDCPNESECAFEIISSQLTLIDGYCLRPCSASDDCTQLGSTCGVQDMGDYCF